MKPLAYFVLLICTCSSLALADVRKFQAMDTLSQTLEGLTWEPTAFEVTCSLGNTGGNSGGGGYDAEVAFVSPRPSGIEALDRVTMWWYAARDSAGEPIEAPAVLMIHSLHSKMPIAQLMAKNFSARGLHAFVMHLPGYHHRQDSQGHRSGVTALLHADQAVTDVRRARDAIAALPNILPGPIALQGTSLGGFVASTAAGLDGAFEPVFLILSGGNVRTVLTDGRADAARMRQYMRDIGYDGDKLWALFDHFEPLNVAHRLDPAKTFLFSARFDQVVPLSSSKALSKAIGLDEQHHLWLDGDHYTASVFLPGIIEKISETIHANNQ